MIQTARVQMDITQGLIWDRRAFQFGHFIMHVHLAHACTRSRHHTFFGDSWMMMDPGTQIIVIASTEHTDCDRPIWTLHSAHGERDHACSNQV